MSIALASTAKYTGDSGSDIDNVAAGGFVAIVHPTTASLGGNQAFIIKGSLGNTPSLQLDTSGNLIVTAQRATTNLLASTALSNFPSVGINEWLVIAGRYNAAGSSTAQQLFAARLGQALREPSSYSGGQQTGTGAQVDDSAASIFVGNASGGARPVTCPLFAAAMFNAYPSLAEITRVARELLQQGRRPVFSAPVARAYRFDRGIGTLVCLKTQAELVPSGTITLAPNPPRPMAGALRFAPGVESAAQIPDAPTGGPDRVRLGQQALRAAANAAAAVRYMVALLQRARADGLPRFTAGGTQGTGASTTTGGATSTGGRVRHLSLLRLNRRRR